MQSKVRRSNESLLKGIYIFFIVTRCIPHIAGNEGTLCLDILFPFFPIFGKHWVPSFTFFSRLS